MHEKGDNKMTVFTILGAYALGVNILGILVMGIDKIKAKNKAWRIPEATLFTVALFGGSLGTTLGMFLFHHKTRHWYFRYGMPLILILQIASAYYLLHAPLNISIL